jgi:hypothetical protein
MEAYLEQEFRSQYFPLSLSFFLSSQLFRTGIVAFQRITVVKYFRIFVVVIVKLTLFFTDYARDRK